jgi:hypothetical protein
MFNSEPFTHTGVLASYQLTDNLEIYAGWTLGWDTGFNQNGKGNNFLGGVAATLTDAATLTYVLTAGNMGDDPANFYSRGEGYTHSVVLDVDLTCNLKYVLQSDFVNLTTPVGDRNDEYGVNQYLIYQLNNCWSFGSRMEWWKSDSGFDLGGQFAAPGGTISYYEFTKGINYIPHPNVRVRPEVRYDWVPAADFDQTVFAVDLIMLF